MIFHCKKFDNTREIVFSVLTKQDDYLNLIPVNRSNMGNIYKSLEVFLNPKYLSAMTQIPKLLKHNNLNTMQIKREENYLPSIGHLWP